MSTRSQSRSSAAKEIDPKGLEGTSLGDVQPTTGEFNREAANDNNKSPEQASEQVGRTGAEPRVKPPQEVERAGAAGAHRAEMAKDDLASKLSPRQMAVYQAVLQRMEAERGMPSPAQSIER